LVQQRKNRFLKTDSDRLLEKILTADIFSLIMNDLYKSSNAMMFDNYCADIDLLNKETETLKHKYETLRQNSDDVRNKLSNENCQLKQRLEWCQAQSLETELQLQSQNVSKSCQLCKDNVFLKNKCL
jgi:FtsZ-binding cell division protein ZapB